MLYRTTRGPVVRHDDKAYAIARDWDELVNDDALYDTLQAGRKSLQPDSGLLDATAGKASASGNHRTH